LIAFLILALHIVVSPFKTKVRLEAEIISLRHQFNVLRRRVPAKPRTVLAQLAKEHQPTTQLVWTLESRQNSIGTAALH
jgi:hypothetical protein